MFIWLLVPGTMLETHIKLRQVGSGGLASPQRGLVGLRGLAGLGRTEGAVFKELSVQGLGV